MVGLTDRPDMNIAVYRGRKATHTHARTHARMWKRKYCFCRSVVLTE